MTTGASGRNRLDNSGHARRLTTSAYAYCTLLTPESWTASATSASSITRRTLLTRRARSSSEPAAAAEPSTAEPSTPGQPACAQTAAEPGPGGAGRRRRKWFGQVGQ